MRGLEDRIKEHKSACIKCDTEKSALAEHAWNEGHHAAWEKVTILDDKRRRFRLIIKEALHIKNCKKPLLNRDTGLELPGCWLPVLRINTK